MAARFSLIIPIILVNTGLTDQQAESSFKRRVNAQVGTSVL